MFPSCRLQFTAWVDAVIFVFSLENESSFKAIYNYYTQMAHFRNSAEIPLILVGTQGWKPLHYTIPDCRLEFLGAVNWSLTYYSASSRNTIRVWSDLTYYSASSRNTI
uniref:Uncharacterized protein n=1 Tax=Timema poppense TaxID=170557 RepID=A0A7R9GWS1_TIMPO|nr:unnamed protein product [Timema poppensis]